jgi:hypothetical protein
MGAMLAAGGLTAHGLWSLLQEVQRAVLYICLRLAPCWEDACAESPRVLSAGAFCGGNPVPAHRGPPCAPLWCCLGPRCDLHRSTSSPPRVRIDGPPALLMSCRKSEMGYWQEGAPPPPIWAPACALRVADRLYACKIRLRRWRRSSGGRRRSARRVGASARPYYMTRVQRRVSAVGSPRT